jgi:hypothetical protein
VAEDEGAEPGEVVADDEVGVGEEEDRQDDTQRDDLGKGRARHAGHGWIGEEIGRTEAGQGDQEGEHAHDLGGAQRQLREAPLRLLEGRRSVEIALDRRKQPGRHEPVHAEQQDEADADRTRREGPCTLQGDEDEVEGDIDARRRHRHQEIAPADCSDLGRRRDRVHVGPTR